MKDKDSKGTRTTSDRGQVRDNKSQSQRAVKKNVLILFNCATFCYDDNGDQVVSKKVPNTVEDNMRDGV